MSKIWIIGLGGAVAAAVIGAAVYLHWGREPVPAPTAARSERPVNELAGVMPDDRVVGAEDAPVTVIEYASMTCPHCASFHLDVWPAVKERWVDSGQVRFVFRDFPLDELALRAAALARCVEGEASLGMVSLLFESQQGWSRASDPIGVLARVGRLGGIPDEQARACLEDEAKMDAAIAQRTAGQEAFDITSTPSFVIDGKLYRGLLTEEQFAEILQPLTQ